MLSLLLHIVLLSSFELILKRGVNRRMDMSTIGTLNFAISAPLAMLLLYRQTSATVEWATLGLGTLMGACYFLSFFFILYAIAQQGVAATRAVIQLAILIPITFSIFLWNEHPQGIQTLGIIIAVGSLFLLGGRGDLGRRKRATLRWKLAAGLVLVGTARVSAKAFSEMKAPEETAFFLIALFSSAAIAAAVKLLLQRQAISPRAWALGSVLACLNVFHSLFLMRALHQLPGIIVFPASACGALAVTTLIATLLLGERPTSRQYVGIAASSFAVVALSLTGASGA